VFVSLSIRSVGRNDMTTSASLEQQDNELPNSDHNEDNIEISDNTFETLQASRQEEASSWDTSTQPRLVQDDSYSQEERMKQIEVIGKKLVQDGRNIYLAKLPSTIGVEPIAFQPEKKWEQENETRDSTMKIRYRKSSNNNNNWESNTRLVKWEDGSSSLFIGNECFDVTEQDIREESQLFLFRRQPTAQVAECRISHKLKIQPASISLGLQRKLGTYERFTKERKVKMAEMDRAPELEEQKLAQLEHERARAQARLEAKRRRKEQLVMENWRNAGMSNEFLDSDYSSNEEESDEDPSFSIANVKSRIGATSTEIDTSLSSKAQVERENPSRLDKLKESDKPLAAHREAAVSSEERDQSTNSVALFDVERRHHKVFMLSDEEEEEEEEKTEELEENVEETSNDDTKNDLEQDTSQ
jgi:RNA polymerase-associated protein LEO1